MLRRALTAKPIASKGASWLSFISTSMGTCGPACLSRLVSCVLICRREGRRLDSGELVLELGDGGGALHRLAELGQAGLLHPPSAIGQRLSHLLTPPGGQSLEGKEQQAAGLMPHRLWFERCRHGQQQHLQQRQEAIGAEGPGEDQQPEGIGELRRQQRQGRRQHKHHQQPIGRGGGEARQPLALALRQRTLTQPAFWPGAGRSRGQPATS